MLMLNYNIRRKKNIPFTSNILLNEGGFLVKKKILFVFMLCLLIFSTVALAAEQGYEFNLKYDGEIIKNEAKFGSVTLSGTDATPYTNVRIKVELVSGPATPKLIAYDSNGTEFDIAEIGYWGPQAGFTVGGTFTNETPITATYPQVGTYVTKLSLVDVNNNEAVLASKEFTITVKEKETIENNVVVNNTVIENNTDIENNVVENIPQAGISFWTYIIVIAAVIIALWAIIYFVKNKKN